MMFVQEAGLYKKALQLISKSPVLGVDTEADSLHRYHEKLCLLQISTDREDFVFDPLSGLDLTELVRLMETKPLILHGADFDLRILWRFYKFSPKVIFDTMLAAQIIGLKEQSLASLVNKYCQVKLAKTNQKADWSKRPLTRAMLVYAANDTHFLRIIHDELINALNARSRLSWLEESCRELIKSVRVLRVSSTEKWRVKGSRDLKPKQLGLLKAIWEWREEMASKKDRPSFKVLNNDALIEIAIWKSEHHQESIESMPKRSRQLKPDWLKNLDAVLKRAWQMPPQIEVKPKPKLSRRLTTFDKKKVQVLKTLRRKLAADLECDPGILAPNAAIERIVMHAPKTYEEMRKASCLKNWQLGVVAEPFQEALDNVHYESP